MATSPTIFCHFSTLRPFSVPAFLSHPASPPTHSTLWEKERLEQEGGSFPTVSNFTTEVAAGAAQPNVCSTKGSLAVNFTW